MTLLTVAGLLLVVPVLCVLAGADAAKVSRKEKR
jgi:hypothetical protein